MNNKLKSGLPIILSVAASVGVIATAVFAAKASPKAEKALAEYKSKTERDISKKEVFKETYKYYIPTAMSAAATIACITSSTVVSKKCNASLLAACALASKSYRDYTSKVKELYGQETHDKIIEAIAIEKAQPEPIFAEGFLQNSTLDFKDKFEERHSFYDVYSGRKFESTFSKVLEAEYHFNRNYVLGGSNCINEFYKFIGLEPIEGGDEMGFDVCSEIYWVDFNHHKAVLDDGFEYYMIDFVFAPEPLGQYE